MAKAGFEISNYYVVLTRGEGTAGGLQAYASISCMSADRLSGLTVYFIPEGGSAPDNSASPDARFGMLYVPDKQFSWYIDLLRNEKPVRAVISSDQPNRIRIQTGLEPVGEEEESEDTMTSSQPPSHEPGLPRPPTLR